MIFRLVCIMGTKRDMTMDVESSDPERTWVDLTGFGTTLPKAVWDRLFEAQDSGARRVDVFRRNTIGVFEFRCDSQGGTPSNWRRNTTPILS